VAQIRRIEMPALDVAADAANDARSELLMAGQGVRDVRHEGVALMGRERPASGHDDIELFVAQGEGRHLGKSFERELHGSATPA